MAEEGGVRGVEGYIRPGGSSGRHAGTSQLAPNRSIKRKSPPPAAQFFMSFPLHSAFAASVCVCVRGVCVCVSAECVFVYVCTSVVCVCVAFIVC